MVKCHLLSLNRFLSELISNWLGRRQQFLSGVFTAIIGTALVAARALQNDKKTPNTAITGVGRAVGQRRKFRISVVAYKSQIW